MLEVYKIVIKDNDGYKTLFNTINGSRKLQINSWIKANIKLSIDGSGGKPYLTGIHCFKDNKKAIKYLNKFRTKKNRIIIKCKAKGLRKKPTNSDVFLADEILIKNNEEKI